MQTKMYPSLEQFTVHNNNNFNNKYSETKCECWRSVLIYLLTNNNFVSLNLNLT